MFKNENFRKKRMKMKILVKKGKNWKKSEKFYEKRVKNENFI